MPESSSGEKVFPATERKRKEARRKGQVAHSVELSAALVTCAMLLWLKSTLSSGGLIESLIGDFQTAFRFNPHPNGFDLRTATNIMQQAVIWGVTLAGPGLLLAGTVGLVSGIAQVGFFFSTEALAPKFEKINPATGIKRLFSKLGLIETFKGSLKIGLIAWSTYVVLQNDMPLLISASQNQLVTFIGAVGNTVWEIALRVAGVLLVVAVADYGVQKFEFEKNLRMTHQEMKQELKMAEGDPVIRQRIRQQQKNISQRRMMEKVPKATVVITNPTHFAVALQYEKGENKAPIVVAKGQDFIAQQIKKVAREANVPIVENVELARKLYREVEIGREIPPQLYKAVAEVLAFVYRMHRSRFSSLS